MAGEEGGVKKRHRERPRNDLGTPTIVPCQLEPGLGGESEGPGRIPLRFMTDYKALERNPITQDSCAA